MNFAMEYLSAHPLIAVGLGIIAGFIVFSLVKKLFKFAVVLIIVFLVAGGGILHVSRKEVEEKGKTLLNDARKKVNGVMDEYLPAEKTAAKVDTLAGKISIKRHERK